MRLVLDDFGVGFSSLGYLKRLPLSMVKLDRTFVENVTDSSDDAAIVRAVSEMAETIGIGVVAEGVETEEQVRVARELGCGYAQGFHFSEPVPASYVERLLAQSDAHGAPTLILARGIKHRAAASARPRG